MDSLLALVEHSADFMGISTIEGHTFYMNKMGRQLLGLGELQDLSGFRTKDYFAEPSSYEAIIREIELSLREKGKWSGKITLRNFMTREEIPFQADYILIRDPKTGEAIGRGATLHDLRPEINARREILDAARKTAESEERFRVLASSMPQFVWMAGPDGKLTYFNHAFLEFTGLTEEEALGDGWPVIVHPNERSENIRTWRLAVENGHDYTFQQRFRSREGVYRWQLSRAVPLRNDKGEILQWLGTSTDIDEQKKMADELESMVRERTAALSESNLNLERTNRELEQFAYVASHDLQEPLRKIRIFAEMLGVTLPGGDTSAQTYLHKINLAATRMSVLIKDLLNFSQLQGDSSQFRNTDLNSVLSDVEGDFELLIHQKNAVVMAEPLPVVEAIPLQVNQLFYNLLGNSLKFTSDDRKPLIFITSRPVQGAGDEMWPGLDPGRKYHEITFRDNGIGFSQEYASQIFTIFQRLNNRESFDGTGIGLAICKKIALNHHGDIKAFSGEGMGASFHILMPETQPISGTR